MEAMLLEDNPAAQARAAAALSEAGFEVTLAESVQAAKTALRRGVIDVLVLAERVGGRLAHDVALLAELRNPGLGTILVTDRSGPALAEIFELIPSVHAILGRRTPARTLARLALAASRWQDVDEAAPSGPERREDPVAPMLLRPHGGPLTDGGGSRAHPVPARAPLRLAGERRLHLA